jgi:hypothetical protein
MIMLPQDFPRMGMAHTFEGYQRAGFSGLGIDCNNLPAGMDPDEFNRLCESQAPVSPTPQIDPESAAKVAPLIAKYPCMAAGLVLSNPAWTQPDLATIEGQIALGLFGAPGRSPCAGPAGSAVIPVPQSYEQAAAAYGISVTPSGKRAITVGKETGGPTTMIAKQPSQVEQAITQPYREAPSQAANPEAGMLAVYQEQPSFLSQYGIYLLVAAAVGGYLLFKGRS